MSGPEEGKTSVTRHTGKGQAGQGSGTEARPGPRPVPRVPVTFPGTATHSGPAGKRSPQMP